METAADPFVILADIAQRSTAGERGLPQQIDAQTMWSGIGFSLCGQRFVVPMTEVTELLERPMTTRIPGVKPWVKGVSNVRGRLLPMVDLEAYFGGQLATNRKRHRVLAIDTGDIYSGVLVSEVFGMMHFPIDGHSELLAGSQGSEQMVTYLKGSYSNGQEAWTVFSLHQLLRDPEFFNVAAH